MKTACSGVSERIQYEQSIEFLCAQHQELVGSLHEEIERLKRKNRGLVSKALFVWSASFKFTIVDKTLF